MVILKQRKTFEPLIFIGGIMDSYYVNRNAQPTGENEVHKSGCNYMPDAINKMYLGEFYNCQDAVKEAKKTYSNVDGCYYCCKLCHTR